MTDWLRFMGVVLGWALVGRLVLELQIVQPWALALAWFVGLIWLVGRAAGSNREADHLLKVTLGFFGACGLIAAVVVLASS